MPEIGDALTLLDIARRLDPNGNIAAIAEMLTQTNEVLLDIPWVEGNLPTGHKTTVRTGLPEPTWRKLNYGVQPSKSATAQVTDTCGMLEAYAEVDKDLADLNGNTAAFRLSEDRAHIEGMNQEMAAMAFYGDTATNPERILGLAPRFAVPSAAENNIGRQLINGGGSGNNNTSVWLVVWGAQTVHGIYPKGSRAGLSQKDLGEQTLIDPQGGRYQGYRTHYQWKCGLTVRDWRYIVRICNLDVAALATAGDTADTSANLIKLMIKAMNRVPNLRMGRPAFYCNVDVLTPLQVKIMDKANVWLQMSDITGPGGLVTKALTFQGIPVRRVDQLLSTEAAIAGTFA